MLILEEMSEMYEQEYLEHARKENLPLEDGFGVVLKNVAIRDLKGLGWAHLGSDGRTWIKSVLDVGIPNYPGNS